MALSPWLFRLAALPYDWMTGHPVWRKHCALMAERIPAAGRERRIIVDLGCGPGVSTLALAEALPNDGFIGLDYAPAMLRLAMRHDPQRRCGWLRGDAHRLPFRSGSLHAVTAHSFLYLLEDQRIALAEMRRVLRPGGTLVLMEPSSQGLAEALASVRESFRQGGAHLAFTMACWRIAARQSGAFGPGELASLLEGAGFEGSEVTATLHGLGWLSVASTAPGTAASTVASPPQESGGSTRSALSL